MKIPADSILNISKHTHDYVSSFQGCYRDCNNLITSADVGRAFFGSIPKWINLLIIFRDKVVGIFGIKKVGNIKVQEKQLTNFKCEQGEQIGLFKVIFRNNKEVILGEDDSHLNFRVSLYSEMDKIQHTKKRLTLTIVVEFKNWFGKLYFLPIRPFHKIFGPSLLKGILKEIEILTIKDICNA
ncbi:DUF2867 domain-containing protein [Flavivirga spongiicola]|uniref:DUF2867 domain-containing protein n=1 Tax=Flavivirga spongiicola TaxID=421621 RepID=A0ABU7XPG1_9FLAO|nr:DUF2867 domain-containing protein [Flavivirga sp. MEBiC05379]MDO5977328.1 DUF2867 domain-containing protein [Flavivirga sp. MEBiC05379]